MRSQDLRRIANQKGISVGFLEKDYAITCFLESLYSSNLGDSLIFKGGTALKKVYFPGTWRLSHDLDFTFIGDFDSKIIESELQLVFEKVAIRGISMSLESFHVTSGSVIAEIRFRGPLEYPNVLKLDITLDEELVLDPEWVYAESGYPDIPNFSMKTYSLVEILVEKIRSLMQRSRSRDYFDVWKLFIEKEFDIIEVKELLIKKCQTRSIEYKPSLIFDTARLEEVRAYWMKGLSDLVKYLPDFDLVIKELKEELEIIIKND